MTIQRLDHVNLRTTKLADMIAWYRDVLGLASGPRPDFPFNGAWMYVGDLPVVHIVEIPEDNAIGSEVELKLEHFAFRATDRDTFEAHLKSLGETFRIGEPPGSNIVQINVWDPDGNHIHVDFEKPSTK